MIRSFYIRNLHNLGGNTLDFSKVKKLTKEVCIACAAKCCSSIAIEIESPTTEEFRQYIRWYLAHKDVSIFVEDGEWFVEFHTVCEQLDSDNACGIYNKRPDMCKEYGYDDDGDINCHISQYPFDYEHEFRSLEEFDEYLAEETRKRLKKYTRKRPGKKK